MLCSSFKEILCNTHPFRVILLHRKCMGRRWRVGINQWNIRGASTQHVKNIAALLRQSALGWPWWLMGDSLQDSETFHFEEHESCCGGLCEDLSQFSCYSCQVPPKMKPDGHSLMFRCALRSCQSRFSLNSRRIERVCTGLGLLWWLFTSEHVWRWQSPDNVNSVIILMERETFRHTRWLFLIMYLHSTVRASDGMQESIPPWKACLSGAPHPWLQYLHLCVPRISWRMQVHPWTSGETSHSISHGWTWP